MKQTSLEDHPLDGYDPLGSTIRDNSVRVSNQTGYLNGSNQNRPDQNNVGCYNISQFSTPNSSRQVSGFPGLVPLPSSSYGIHRRSRTSAVLLRAQKFESRVQQQQQQQQQQPLNQFQRTLPTRASNERMGPSSRSVLSSFTGINSILLWHKEYHDVFLPTPMVHKGMGLWELASWLGLRDYSYG